MDSQQISILATQIRSSSHNKQNLFTISTTMLSYLLSAFELIEEQSTSFSIKTSPNIKAELFRDLQFLHTFFQQTKTLKIYETCVENGPSIDITKFKNLLSVEFFKVNVNSVKGLQALRSQLQKLTCHKTSNTLTEVLSDCGGDKSHSYCWNELKEASFISNEIIELDQSLECAPWLHTLDLSHNEIKNMDAVSCLPNLKYLNLSYNKLEAVPLLKGQICTRLQHLILKNNFIEDISGLRPLTNIWVLDLANNCLIDHKSLLPLSHLATLQWLNLENNPLTFHPHHRTRTAGYLHANTASTHFVLDHVTMSKGEKKMAGSYYPLHQSFATSMTDSMSLSSEKVRRVREVVIEEEAPVRVPAPKLSASPQRHLETKKQIEDLHATYGESWLNSQSGQLVQNVLGLENSPLPLSSSPYEADFTIYSGDFAKAVEETVTEEAVEASRDVYEATVEDSSQDEAEAEVEGEESIYLATVSGESEPVFIVIGQTHFSEKECSTSEERVRWHVDSIISCEVVKDDPKAVQVDFETMRKDRKRRVYIFDEEMEAFLNCVRNKINSRIPKQVDDIKYQCMKCSVVFVNVKNESILGEAAVKCPSCDSNLVVEH